MKLYNLICTQTDRAPALTAHALYARHNPSAPVHVHRRLFILISRLPVVAYTSITSVLGKGITYLVAKLAILSKLLQNSLGGICLGALVTGFTLGSYSHDAEWTLFQGSPLVAVLSTAFFTFHITDLADLLTNPIPGFISLGHRIIKRQKSQDKRLGLINIGLCYKLISG